LKERFAELIAPFCEECESGVQKWERSSGLGGRPGSVELAQFGDGGGVQALEFLAELLGGAPDVGRIGGRKGAGERIRRSLAFFESRANLLPGLGYDREQVYEI
jgi:hypothetical protein